MVSGALDASDRAQQRHQGYLQGMAAVDLKPQLLQVPFTDGATERVAEYLAARLVIPQAPTAVVCSNDVLAIRCIRAAHLVGLRVPDDLSVAGFDGIGIGEELTPALSTIVQPSAEIGRRAVELLVQALAGAVPLGPGNSLTLDLHFRAGESRIPSPNPTRSLPRRISP
jgi:DNA-binding LacI/PurR family transcriptional regulator